jgi:flagellar biogenesis protein FliO
MFLLRKVSPASVGPLQVIGRTALDPKRTIYLVKIGEKVLVVGGTDGALTKLATLRASEVQGAAIASNKFSDVLKFLTQKAAKTDDIRKPTDDSNPHVE